MKTNTANFSSDQIIDQAIILIILNTRDSFSLCTWIEIAIFSQTKIKGTLSTGQIAEILGVDETKLRELIHNAYGLYPLEPTLPTDIFDILNSNYTTISRLKYIKVNLPKREH